MPAIRARLVTVLLAATLLTQTACSSAPILTEPPLTPAPGASLAQVDRAIRTGISRASQDSTGVWIVEQGRPGVIVTGIRVRGKHYLQVTYTFTAQSVTSRISGSQGLDQTADTINKRANVWHQRLDLFVQQALVEPGARG